MGLSQVGPYELQRPLGAGGMAETFVAVRRGPAGFEQRVCLKRILPGRAADASFVELFLDEARLLAKLRNAAIVQVYDFGESDGTYYMALELVDGMDLEALLQRLIRQGKRMPWTLAVYIASQILSALHYAHGLVVDGQSLSLVHRDISPSNILLSQQGEVKLTDFGIAKATGRTHKTQTGHTKGKVAYMSPEQVRGEDLDSRSDLFAVGVVLYEMLAGAHPFDAPTDLTLLNNILNGSYKPLPEAVSEIPEALRHLLGRLLAVSPSDRPSTPGDALLEVSLPEQPFVLQNRLAGLVSELRPLGTALPASTSTARANDGATQLLPDARTGGSQPATPAKGTGAHDATEKSASPTRQIVAAGAICLVALVALGFWWKSHSQPPPGAPQVASAPAPAAAMPPVTQPPTAKAPGFDRPTALPTEPTRTPGDTADLVPLEPDGVSSSGGVLHEPDSRADDARGDSNRLKRQARHHGGEAPPGSTNSAEEAARKLKARSGASVSVDDF